MLSSFYEVEQVMMQRVKDALHEAEQARLIRMVQGARESQGRRLVTAILDGLQVALTRVSVPEPRRTDRLCQSAYNKTVCSQPGGYSAECRC